MIYYKQLVIQSNLVEICESQNIDVVEVIDGSVSGVRLVCGHVI